MAEICFGMIADISFDLIPIDKTNVALRIDNDEANRRLDGQAFQLVRQMVNGR